MAERFEVPRDVAVVDEDEVVYVARLPQGPIVALDGSAQVIWRAVTDRSVSREWVSEVARRFGEPVDVVGPSAEEFVEDLLGRGLLHRRAG